MLFSAVSMPEDVMLEMTWPAAPLLLVLWTVVLSGLGWWRARTADVL